MKRLLHDKMRRGWLIFVLYSLVFFVIGLALPIMLEFSQFPYWWLIYLLVFSNTTTELASGYGRVVLTLPFTTREIGRFIWLLAVAAPTLLLALFSGLGILIMAASSGFDSAILWPWMRLVMAAGLLFGSVFWINSGSSVPQPTKQQRIASQGYGILFWIGLVGGGYLLYKGPFGSEIKYAIACLFGLFFTISGWHRADGLVADCGGYRQTGLSGATNSGKSPLPTGFGGMRYLLTRQALRQLGLLPLILAVLAVFNIINHRKHWWDISDMKSLAIFCFIFYPIQEMEGLLLHLKFLRSLPVISRQLAGMFLSIPVLPFLFYGSLASIITGLQQGREVGFSWFKACVLGIGPVCVMAAAAVWHGERRFGRIVVVATVFVISGIAPVYQMTANGTGLPIWFAVGYALAFLISAILTISHLIEANDMTYRLRAQDLEGGWSWGAGR